MDKVNQYISPGNIEDLNLSVHSTPAVLRYTTAKYKDKQTEQRLEEKQRLIYTSEKNRSAISTMEVM
jgi:uncharacterized protein with gpF-like domain